MKENIWNYIKLVDLETMTKRILFFIVFFSFCGFIFAISDPFNKSIFKIIVYMILVIDIYGLLLIFDILNKQNNYYLFMGMFYLIASLTCFLRFYKDILVIPQMANSRIIQVILIIYISIIVLNFILIRRRIKLGYYHKDKIQKQYTTSIISSIAIGFLTLGVTRFMVNIAGPQNQDYAITGLILMLSLILALGVQNLYKYYLSKRYGNCIE